MIVYIDKKSYLNNMVSCLSGGWNAISDIVSGDIIAGRFSDLRVAFK
jgi:hypothetical protein